MRELFEKAFLMPLERLADQFAGVVPGLVTVALVLIVGGIVAGFARMVTERLLRWGKFDRVMAQTELGSVIHRTGIFRSASDFAARLVQGALWLLFILVALDAVDTEVTRNLVVRFVNYVPDLITAGLVLLLGSLISNFLGRSALLAAVNAGWSGARLIAGGIRLLVISLTVVVALEQLRIGKTALLVAFAILFGGVVVAGAIAFGLAGRDLVRDWLEAQTRAKETKEEGFRHL